MCVKILMCIINDDIINNDNVCINGVICNSNV